MRRGGCSDAEGDCGRVTLVGRNRGARILKKREKLSQ
jgi:hypothetical protein